ncbi:MAG: S41 family peptidase [Magnetospirillum sp. WYHS-4]
MIVIGLATLCVGGCVGSRVPSEEGGAAFSREMAEKTIATGFARIGEMALEPIAARRLALEGLKGLSGLDPELAIAAVDGEVTLAVEGYEGLRFPAPADTDAGKWASLVVEVGVAARHRSEEIRAADTERFLETVLDAALAPLDDPYSRYAGAEEAKKNRARRDGFGGLGLLFRILEGEVRVSQIVPHTPAARADIRIGDRLTHVGEVPLRGLDEKTVTDQLHGPVGSRIKLRLLREGEPEPRELSLARAHVVLPTVTAQAHSGIALLAVGGFNQDTAESILRELEALKRLTGGRLRGIILDLRGNPGGLLSEAVAVADLFLAQGEIVSTRGRHRDSHQHYEATEDDRLQGLPLVLLVDGKTASAAEVLAAALQDRGRAVVAGTTTFGKGSVQTVLRLPNDGEITLTWSRLVAPSGYVLHHLGVLPSICLSGSGSDAAAALVRALKSGEIPPTQAAWREVGIGDEARRKGLRHVCAPEERHTLADREVALRLVADRNLYTQALALGDRPVLARGGLSAR